MAANLTERGAKEFVNPPAPPPGDLDWWERAGCLGADRADFEAGKSVNPPDRAVRAAWANCSWCPVRARCKAWAERAAIPGVYAGEWRRKENPLATRVYVTDLLTPAMRERYERLPDAKPVAA